MAAESGCPHMQHSYTIILVSDVCFFSLSHPLFHTHTPSTQPNRKWHNEKAMRRVVLQVADQEAQAEAQAAGGADSSSTTSSSVIGPWEEPDMPPPLMKQVWV